MKDDDKVIDFSKSRAAKKKGMDAGDVVFFKRARAGMKMTDKFQEFEGYGLGIILGQVAPEYSEGLTHHHILQLLGSIGLVKFDDIIEFLGKEKSDELLLQFRQKYSEAPKPEVIQ